MRNDATPPSTHWLFQIFIKANTYNSIITNIVIIIDVIIITMKVERL